MISLTRCYRFPAAHVLAHRDLSQAENERIYGKCANPAGHGHDYGIEVTVAGPLAAETDEVVDRDALDALVQDRIVGRLGHRMLNEDPAFAVTVPTAENIARFVYAELAPAIASLGAARLARVAVDETRKNRFEVEGDA